MIYTVIIATLAHPWIVIQMDRKCKDPFAPAKFYEEMVTHSSRRKWNYLPTSRDVCASLEAKMGFKAYWRKNLDLPPKETNLYTRVSPWLLLASTFRQVVFGALFDVTELDLSLIHFEFPREESWWITTKLWANEDEFTATTRPGSTHYWEDSADRWQFLHDIHPPMAHLRTPPFFFIF